MRPPGSKNAGDSEPDPVARATPWAQELGHFRARQLGVRKPDEIEQCQQEACLALAEAVRLHDPARGPLEVFAWKRIVGAVTRLVRRERRGGRTGFDDALDAADEARDTSDLFADDDDEAKGSVKADCRLVTLALFVGDKRVELQKSPEDALLRARAVEALESVLGEVDETERRLMVLRWLEGATWDEIALALGKSGRQAQRIEERLKNRLQSGLKKRGIEEAPPSA
jgi:RNA polymerase sigma factor (sigma-70 family)